jgi:hypothetical protein
MITASTQCILLLAFNNMFVVCLLATLLVSFLARERYPAFHTLEALVHGPGSSRKRLWIHCIKRAKAMAMAAFTVPKEIAPLASLETALCSLRCGH